MCAQEISLDRWSLGRTRDQLSRPRLFGRLSPVLRRSIICHTFAEENTDRRQRRKIERPLSTPFLTTFFSLLVSMCTSVRAGGLDGQETLFHVFSCFSLSPFSTGTNMTFAQKAFISPSLLSCLFFLGKRARKETFHFFPSSFFPASRLFIEKLPPSSQQRPLKPWRAGEEEEKSCLYNTGTWKCEEKKVGGTVRCDPPPPPNGLSQACMSYPPYPQKRVIHPNFLGN